MLRLFRTHWSATGRSSTRVSHHKCCLGNRSFSDIWIFVWDKDQICACGETMLLKDTSTCDSCSVKSSLASLFCSRLGFKQFVACIICSSDPVAFCSHLCFFHQVKFAMICVWNLFYLTSVQCYALIREDLALFLSALCQTAGKRWVNPHLALLFWKKG